MYDNLKSLSIQRKQVSRLVIIKSQTLKSINFQHTTLKELFVEFDLRSPFAVLFVFVDSLPLFFGVCFSMISGISWKFPCLGHMVSDLALKLPVVTPNMKKLPFNVPTILHLFRCFAKAVRRSHLCCIIKILWKLRLAKQTWKNSCGLLPAFTIFWSFFLFGSPIF